MYDQEAADRVCALLSEGKSLRYAAGEVGLTHTTILGWVDAQPAFSDQYTRARQVGYQLLSDELLEIADDKTEADTNRARLQVDTRKWMLSKMLPKTYGDKLTTEVTGNLKHDHTVVLQPESQRFLEQMRGGSGGPGSALPVSD
jgi:hypothetical protein